MSEPGRSGRLRRLTLPVSLNKALVIGRRVNAAARVLHHANMNPPTEREDAELLQLFQFFQRLRRQRGEAEQEAAAIGVQADVLQETGRLALEVEQPIA